MTVHSLLLNVATDLFYAQATGAACRSLPLMAVQKKGDPHTEPPPTGLNSRVVPDTLTKRSRNYAGQGATVVIDISRRWVSQLFAVQATLSGAGGSFLGLGRRSSLVSRL